MNTDKVTDHEILLAMKRFGGGFASSMAETAMHADSENLQRIKDGWPDYWERYTNIARTLKAEKQEVSQ